MDTIPQEPRTARRPSRSFVVAAGLTALLVGVGIHAAEAQSQDPQTATIEQVIQTANDEQVQAIAAQDPAAMSDTSTSDHYQQLVQINQSLLSQGVTGIKLANLTWGPVSVNATNATATTSETWTTTFQDGTTTQETDTNNYLLVEQNGAWLISDDQQPAASPLGQGQGPTPGQGQSPAPSQGQPPASSQGQPPAVSRSQATSQNWSGYAATQGSYTSVSGTWTVPQPSVTGAGGVGATWVGIGGINSHDLIQAGTQDVASGTGQSQYQAWIEMLPQASRQVPLAVSPGDSVSVSINEQGGAGSGAWQISFTNNTTGKSYQTNVRYQSTEASVEWVEEAPVGNGGLLPLDNFSSVDFSQASATQNGQTVDLSQAGAKPITMLNGAGQALAVPSAIGSDGGSFSVSRTSASSTPAPTTRGRSPRSVQPVVTIPFGLY